MAVTYQTLKALGGVIKKVWLKWKKYNNSKKSKVVPISAKSNALDDRQNMTEVPFEISD